MYIVQHVPMTHGIAFVHLYAERNQNYMTCYFEDPSGTRTIILPHLKAPICFYMDLGGERCGSNFKALLRNAILLLVQFSIFHKD